LTGNLGKSDNGIVGGSRGTIFMLGRRYSVRWEKRKGRAPLFISKGKSHKTLSGGNEGITTRKLQVRREKVINVPADGGMGKKEKEILIKDLVD